jgi:hypothetical protein
VYRGNITGTKGFVAFKKPNANMSATQLKNLLSEIKIMSYIGKHENVVILLGAHTEGIKDGDNKNPYQLVPTFVDSGLFVG